MRRTMMLISILMCGMSIICWILYPDRANSGPYLDSAHGNTLYGVNRSSLSTFGYSKGNCAHCHEQHASIGGSEPAPTGGPDKYALFYTNHVSQTDNFCYKCHTDSSSLQAGGLVNRSYSYRAGGWTADTLNDILEAFRYGPPTSTTSSSHRLDDIKTFINGKWGYTANYSNPCAACHNPHRAKGDPANSPNTAKSSTTRGWPVSRPSDHVDKYVWDTWGDDTGEKMRDYVGALTYQAPYRFGSTAAYEPDGSATTDGSNLTDYVTFCLDCHGQSPTPYSTRLGRYLYLINWETSSINSMHGKYLGDESDNTKKPPYYVSSGKAVNHVLSCTDCHEPHGSPNYGFLIRREVNGGIASVTANTKSDWANFCTNCHYKDHAATSCIACHNHGPDSKKF
jgi:hypothetical protein